MLVGDEDLKPSRYQFNVYYLAHHYRLSVKMSRTFRVTCYGNPAALAYINFRVLVNEPVEQLESYERCIDYGERMGGYYIQKPVLK